MEGERRPTGGAGGGGPVKPDVKGSGGSGGGGGGSRGAIFDDPSTKAAETGTPDTVVVHPLVLLSVVDHFFRMGYKDAKDKRVVGVILGEVDKGRVDVVNSFALPFEEDPKDPGVFYLDHDYLESMYSMFRKISAKEKILGFYSTGPRIRVADTKIDALFRTSRYCTRPLLLIVEVQPTVEGLPVQAYVTREEVAGGGRDLVRTFVHVPTEVGAFDAESVGVEHLLRDINNPSTSNLAGDIQGKLVGLKGLTARLGEISAYLEKVLDGRLPQNNELLNQLQIAITLLPNVSAGPLPSALFEVTNDEHLAMYIAALGRSVVALHELSNNKRVHKELERGEAAAPVAAAAAAAAAVGGGEKKEGDKGGSKK